MRYPPVGRCIYCGSDRYNAADPKLSEEHIVPYAANGRLRLPEASCERCQGLTRDAEESVLGWSAKPYRTQLRYKSRRKTPTHLKLYNVNNTGRWMKIPANEYPQVFALMIWPRPRLLSGRSAEEKYAMNELWIDLDRHEAAREMLRKRGIYSWDGINISNEMIFRMYAKIAHAYLVAEVGLSDFKPLLNDYILNQTGDIMYLIGGTEKPEIHTNKDYQLSYSEEKIGDKAYYVVSVRIFANKMAPTYLAVAGEAVS